MGAVFILQNRGIYATLIKGDSMSERKYLIYELSARAIIANAKLNEDGIYTFNLNSVSTEKSNVYSALHEQDDNALFYQIMCELYGNDFEYSDDNLITDISDIIFYCNFEGIFDRNNYSKKYADLQNKARDMFRPNGIILDFGSGSHRYITFERSAGMSRNAKLSFIREDFYKSIRNRIMLDIRIDKCQLSKLYAYNGLMLSSGTRLEGIDIEREHRVIIIDNPSYTVANANVITVEDDGSDAPVRKYNRVERHENIDVAAFDGAGLISKEYTKIIDKKFCGDHYHTSFQIRLPYIKGMLHEVDFKDFLLSSGTDTITDIFGNTHKINDIDIILTKSMFKGYGWLLDNNMSWYDYWKAFKKYNHALYITNVSKEKPEAFTELNYQFLNTISMTAGEFRPKDLPNGWTHSPQDDKRQWLTKETETAYYNFCANEEYRHNYFLKHLRKRNISKHNGNNALARILDKNPLFINEPVYAKELDNQAERILKKYALGKLIVAGDNRFLSGDLLELLTSLISPTSKKNKRQQTFFSIAMSNKFAENSYYAPKITYQHGEECTLLRNPHIARNEEIQLSVYPEVEQMRKHYLGHLTDIVIVDSHMLAAERLGGADYDGDMIKTISDPLINKCVKRNYEFNSLDNRDNIPLLKIPSADPLIRDANDWEARFETVKSTFSSRVGQISNAAFDRSIIAYNENSDADIRKKYREETETLAILTGLEIDSAKSGIKPDLSEYLKNQNVSRSLFLKYKKLIEDSEIRREWYEETHRQKIKKFFDETDWDNVSSNVERLPYLARQLGKNTPKIKSKPAKDSELFAFAVKSNWKNSLDKNILNSIDSLIRDYEAILSRIRACRVPSKSKQRKSDIERILYSQGKEEIFNSDELYALFQTLTPERISTIRQAICDEQWYFLSEERREDFLFRYLPEDDFMNYYIMLSDFRNGGYRLLGNLICDIDDENIVNNRKQLIRDTDSVEFLEMMQAYIDKSNSKSYRDAVSEKCRELLDKIVKPTIAVQYVVALGKRNLLFDLLLDSIEKNVLKEGETLNDK